MSGRDGASPAFVALVQASAGSIGGVWASFVLQPVEVSKTRIAISQSGTTSTIGMIMNIWNADGLFGLFKGVNAKCYEAGSKNFVYFYVYDALNSFVKAKNTHITTGIKLMLGYIAGVFVTVFTMPLEVLSTRMQTESALGASFYSVLQKILSEDGFVGLFKGFWFNIVLCTNPAIQNTCFDKMKEAILKLRQKHGARVLTPLEAFLLGAIAKAIATVVTFPLVRLKTMLQAGKPPEVPSAERKTTQVIVRVGSTPQMLRSMMFSHDRPDESQGLLYRVATLYRGLGSALTKSTLQAALLYMTKDQVETLVIKVFKLSAKMLRRQNGKLKLGAFSGRALAS